MTELRICTVEGCLKPVDKDGRGRLVVFEPGLNAGTVREAA